MMDSIARAEATDSPCVLIHVESVNDDGIEVQRINITSAAHSAYESLGLIHETGRMIARGAFDHGKQAQAQPEQD